MLPTTLWLIVGSLGFALHSGPAFAHPNHGATLGERYLKLDVRGDRVRVVYGLTYAARHGATVKGTADADGDGRVDDEESRRHGEVLRRAIKTGVNLLIDGVPAPLDWTPPFLGQLQGPVALGPVAVETTAEVTLSPGIHIVILEDRAEFAGIYRTTTTTVVAPDVELRRAGRGRAPRATTRRLIFMDLPTPGTPPARVISAEVGVPEEAATSAPSSWALALGGTAAAIVMLMLVAGGLRMLSARGRGSPAR